MNITDKKVLTELKRVRCWELWESVSEYPEDERDGRTDMQFLADEVSYILSCYDEGGNVFCDDLEWAKEVLKETKNGKVIPMWQESLIPKYSRRDIEMARNSINDYKRLKNCMKRLNASGYYGKW